MYLNSSDSLNTYTVIMLGPSGSGKTVFLASMYKKLSTQGDLGFFLEIDGAEKRKRLNKVYTQIAIDEKWPKGTTYSEVSEWTFTCRVQTENLPIYSACRFTYLDYAGGRITDEMDEEDLAFERKIDEADALLGLLDGQRLCALMRDEKFGKIWAVNDIPNMLNIMQRSIKPIHFVISKWDIVTSQFSFEEIRNRLLEIDEFKNLVKLRIQAGTPVRLIPVSSVGMGFAELQPDGSMAKTGVLPKPFQVEMPLACILPDMIQATLEEIIRNKKEEVSQRIEVKPNLSFWDRLGQIIGSGLKVGVGIVQQMLPKKYQFAEDILESLIDLIDVLEQPAQQKQEAAVKRTEELRYKQAESLKKVANEETALKHVVNCFLSVTNKLDSEFPASNLRL
jgi:adenylate kinase family enzyme